MSLGYVAIVGFSENCAQDMSCSATIATTRVAKHTTPERLYFIGIDRDDLADRIDSLILPRSEIEQQFEQEAEKVGIHLGDALVMMTGCYLYKSDALRAAKKLMKGHMRPDSRSITLSNGIFQDANQGRGITKSESIDAVDRLMALNSSDASVQPNDTIDDDLVKTAESINRLISQADNMELSNASIGAHYGAGTSASGDFTLIGASMHVGWLVLGLSNLNFEQADNQGHDFDGPDAALYEIGLGLAAGSKNSHFTIAATYVGSWDSFSTSSGEEVSLGGYALTIGWNWLYARADFYSYESDDTRALEQFEDNSTIYSLGLRISHFE